MSAPETPAPPARAGAEIGMMAVVLIWGANFTITKAALPYLPPLPFTAIRFAIATLALVLLLRFLEPKAAITKSTWLKLILIGLIGNTLYQPLFIFGLANTTATNCAVIIGSLPGIVALLAWLFRIERVSALVGSGIALSLAGVFLVVGANGVALGGNTTRGDLLTVAAVFCWAAYTLGLRRVDPTLSPLRITTITTASGAPGLILMGLPGVMSLNFATVPSGAWAALLYASLFSVVAAYYFYNTAVQRLGASRASVFSCLIPLVGVFVAWAFLGERPVPMQAIGATLVIIGVWMTRKR
ncbi:MAG: DMT family transporter [Fimbriimonadales bacterium]